MKTIFLHIAMIYLFFCTPFNVLSNDVNQNGKINIDDAILALKVSSGFQDISVSKLINWRGRWTNETVYLIYDSVQYNKSSYICKRKHQSNTLEDAVPTNMYLWDVLAKGVDEIEQYNLNNLSVTELKDIYSAGSGNIITIEERAKLESLKDRISWSEIKEIPLDLSDGDSIGITQELDPTVPNELKDGVDWGEIKNKPKVISSESDPTIPESLKDGVSWNEITEKPLYQKSSHAGKIDDLKTKDTGIYDLNINIGFKPSVIQVDYYLLGYIEQDSEVRFGMATYQDTSLINNYVLSRNVGFSTYQPSAGSCTETDTICIKISITNTNENGFTIRREVQSNTSTYTARAYLYYKAWK